MTRKRALWLVAGIVLLAVGFYLYGSNRPPSGQPPLTALDKSNIGDFQRDFDSASAYTRILLLLSPS